MNLRVFAEPCQAVSDWSDASQPACWNAKAKTWVEVRDSQFWTTEKDPAPQCARLGDEDITDREKSRGHHAEDH